MEFSKVLIDQVTANVAANLKTKSGERVDARFSARDPMRPDGGSLTELVDRLAEGIADRVTRKLSQQPVQPQAYSRRLLSVADAAPYIGRSKRALEHLMADRVLEPVRQGRRVFLDARDLDRWIDESKG